MAIAEAWFCAYDPFLCCFWGLYLDYCPNMAHYKISNRVSHLLIFYLLVFDRIHDAMCLNKMSRTSRRNIGPQHQKYFWPWLCVYIYIYNFFYFLIKTPYKLSCSRSVTSILQGINNVFWSYKCIPVTRFGFGSFIAHFSVCQTETFDKKKKAPKLHHFWCIIHISSTCNVQRVWDKLQAKI